MAQETMHLVPAPEEALTPREHRLERGASVLRVGAIINTVATILVFVAVVVGGTGLMSGVFSLVHSTLLLNYRGTDELAIFRFLFAPDKRGGELKGI